MADHTHDFKHTIYGDKLLMCDCGAMQIAQDTLVVAAPQVTENAMGMTGLCDFLRGEAEAQEQNYRGSLWRADELGVTPEGEAYRRAAYRSEESAQDFRAWLAEAERLRGEVERLTAENNRLDHGWLETSAALCAAEDERDALRARCEAAERDSKRLDWLEAKAREGELPNINVCGSLLYVCFGTGDDEDELAHDESLRAALDAAQSAEGK